MVFLTVSFSPILRISILGGHLHGLSLYLPSTISLLIPQSAGKICSQKDKCETNLRR